jgi:hypothetical protein
LVGFGVAGGLDSCVMSDFVFVSGSGAAAFAAADLVVRTIVVLCRGFCWSDLKRQRAGLLSLTSE